LSVAGINRREFTTKALKHEKRYRRIGTRMTLKERIFADKDFLGLKISLNPNESELEK